MASCKHSTWVGSKTIDDNEYRNKVICMHEVERHSSTRQVSVQNSDVRINF